MTSEPVPAADYVPGTTYGGPSTAAGMTPQEHARMNLFFDFNDAMTRLWKKYGVIEVQEQARSWVEFIDNARRRQSDGSDS